MKKVFDFDKQLKSGKAGETLFLKAHPDIKPLDGFRGDFIGQTGRKIELKTESRASTTPNIFFERYSNIVTKSAGGPFQALEHGAHYYVQMFSDGVCLWFIAKQLVEFLEKAEKEARYWMHNIRNKGWTGGGYAVPQSDVAHLVELRERLKVGGS